MHQEAIMSECGQAYPEYIAPVTDLGKSHGAQTTEEKIHRTTKLHSDFILAPRTQYKRVALACHVWAPDVESATYTIKPIRAEANRTMYARSFRFNQASRETVSPFKEHSSRNT